MNQMFAIHLQLFSWFPTCPPSRKVGPLRNPPQAMLKHQRRRRKRTQFVNEPRVDGTITAPRCIQVSDPAWMTRIPQIDWLRSEYPFKMPRNSWITPIQYPIIYIKMYVKTSTGF